MNQRPQPVVTDPNYLTARKRKPIMSANLVQEESLSDNPLPLVLRPSLNGVDLVAWATANRKSILDNLVRIGGILFRGFAAVTAESFHAFVLAICGEPLEYTYRSTPRTHVGNGIYTSTEYPADSSIPMHNEMAYTRSWPMKIAFFSALCAKEGGETPIADSRRVFQQIAPDVRDRFLRNGVLYVRNYGEGVDLSWQEVFRTDEKEQVEEHCCAHGIEYEWKDQNRLRTRQVCQAIAQHPQTGETVWFNQAHLFHVSALPAVIRETLLSTVGEENLPRNTYYGDGSPIELAALEHIREIYQRESVAFPWQTGDILLLDNMLTAHGRAPYFGPRKVLVAMADPNN
jgi:alpha-ketoglutarate-dependent taurine dioxygenase